MHVRPFVAGAVVAATLFAGATVEAQQVNPAVGPFPAVAVTGEGEAKATPDRALVVVGVESRAQTAAEAASDNARKQRAILDTLRSLGLTQQQLTTANYSVRPDLQYDPAGGEPRLRGYVVSNTVRVDLHRLEQVGPVIDASLAKGANTIHGLSFYLSDPAPSRRAAIVDAVARARADAEALAQAAGGRLGDLIELSTTGMGSGPVMYRAAMDMSARGGMEPTPIVAGEEVVRASVTARWVFVPGS